MRLSLSVQNIAGLAANFHAADRRAQREIRAVVRKSGVRLHGRVHADCPKRTGFMASQLRLEFSEQGLVYALGWSEQDFASAGLAPYFYYVLLGTRRMAGNDFLSRDREQEVPQFREELRAGLRKAIARRGGA